MEDTYSNENVIMLRKVCPNAGLQNSFVEKICIFEIQNISI